MPPISLKHHGEWKIVSVETIIAWPEKNTPITFRDKNLWLLPGDKKLLHAVAIECTTERLSSEAAIELIMNFLSSMAWTERQSIIASSVMGGSFPIRSRGAKYSNTTPRFRATDHLQNPQGERERLALALYREALGLKNNAYRFLGFYKIVNILFNKSKRQKEWINNNVSKIENGRASERIVSLRDQGEDIGNYLFVSGRCAVAHAWDEPIANPDKFEDYKRLAMDVPIIKGLAELIIEQEFGIKSGLAIYREHLYELDGFKVFFGRTLSKKLKNKQKVMKTEIPPLPRISIRLRDHEKFSALENMETSLNEINDGLAIYHCKTEDELFHAVFALDFPQERLRYSFDEGYGFADDGTEACFLYAADVSRFKAHLLANGEFEVWETKTNSLLGRTDPCIPVNIMVGPSFDNFMKIAEQYEQMAKERKKSKKKPKK